MHLTHRTPRPWAHVMANEMGACAVVSNDGEVYSAVGNAQPNGLTPFRFDSATVPLPGQIVYIRDLDAQETDAPGFAPFQREDARHDVTYEPGVATFAKRRGDLETTYVVFVPPDFPGDMRLLRLANHGAKTLRLRIVPFFDIALAESPNESAGKLKDETVGGVLLFENPRNDFERGVAFAATSLPNVRTETIRARFFDGAGRDIHTPALVEAGASDLSQRDDGRRVAAFASDIELAPGAEMKVAIVLGQAATRARALVAGAAATVETVERELAATRAAWSARLGRVRVATNRPDFDRLVNTWLPYQLYASRLFGRVGPNQRGGAFGFRDQLQDVLPLIFIEPRLGAGADRAARGPAIPGRRRAEMVASRPQRGDRRRAAHARQRPAFVAALCSGALCRPIGRRERARRGHALSRGARGPAARGRVDRRAAPLARERRRLRTLPPRHRVHAAPHRRQRLAFARRRRLERRRRRARPRGQGNQRLDGLLLLRRAQRLHSAGAATGRRGLRRALRDGARGGARRAWRPAGGAIITRSTSPTTAARSTCRTR